MFERIGKLHMALALLTHGDITQAFRDELVEAVFEYARWLDENCDARDSGISFTASAQYQIPLITALLRNGDLEDLADLRDDFDQTAKEALAALKLAEGLTDRELIQRMAQK